VAQRGVAWVGLLLFVFAAPCLVPIATSLGEAIGPSEPMDGAIWQGHVGLADPSSEPGSGRTGEAGETLFGADKKSESANAESPGTGTGDERACDAAKAVSIPGGVIICVMTGGLGCVLPALIIAGVWVYCY
jgi:hypothetical protein